MKRLINDVNNLTTNEKKKIRKYIKARTTNDLLMSVKGIIDLGVRRSTQEKRAYRFIAEEYNADIRDERRIKKKQKTEEDTYLKKIVKKIKALKPNEDIKVDIKNNKFGSKLMKQIKGKRLLFTNETSTTTMTPENVSKYIETFDDDSYFVDDAEAEDSYIQAAQNAVSAGKATFTGVGGGGAIAGSFFKYKHKLQGLDLSELQIYDTNHKLKVEDQSCFIQSLITYGVSGELIDQISKVVQKREMPQKMIKKIAEEYGLYITVKSPESNKAVRHYGDKTLPQIELGLVDNHYFLIKKMEITSYAIKNYDKVKDQENWFMIKGVKPNGTFHKDRSKYISSYDVVKILLENKENLLVPVSAEELYSSHFYNLKTEIKDLTPHEKTMKENQYKPRTFTADIDSKKQKYRPFVNVYFDYETTTEGKHEEYLVRASCFPDTEFVGENCGRKLLYALTNKYKKYNLRLIAHNAGYDLRFIMKHLSQISLIERGKMLLRGDAEFYIRSGYSIRVQIQDSYALIPSPLRDFGDMFKLDVEKEIMPYNLYTKANVSKKIIATDVCIEACKKQYKNNNIGCDVNKDDEDEYVKKFMDNANKWNCITNKGINIISYSSTYCKYDCEVLQKGYEKFQSWIKEVCDLDIDDYVSLPSVANEYLMKEGVYEGVYSVSCVTREFINMAMVGGRTMCAENKKHYIKGSVDDFDAVSLYPSAMKRLGGYLKGKPKLLATTEYDSIKNYDGYFVEIEILKVGKKYKFPLMSYVNEDKCKVWSNEMEGKKVVVDKTTLEDLIEFQNVEFKIIRGYYYDEGRNYKLGEVIEYLFNQRLKAKKDKNPIQAVFKLLMNSAYGKTLLKPIEDETHYINNYGEDNETYHKYIVKHYNSIKEIIPLPNGYEYKIKQYKTIDKHFNNVACGVEVLSMSKRIMNEVICLAENSGLNVYYQDTDSLHIDTDHVKILDDNYREKYSKELIGKNMGQFHTDFDSKIIKGDIHAKECIFLGKKCYLDVLTGDDGTIDYHIRMKGVSCEAIKDYAYKQSISILDVYKRLHKGKEIEFDLCCDGSKVSFEFKKNMEIHSRERFVRKIKF